MPTMENWNPASFLPKPKLRKTSKKSHDDVHSVTTKENKDIAANSNRNSDGFRNEQTRQKDAKEKIQTQKYHEIDTHTSRKSRNPENNASSKTAQKRQNSQQLTRDENKVQNSISKKSSRPKSVLMFPSDTHRVVHGKRKSAVDSPTRVMNKKLLQIVANLRNRCELYRDDLKKAKDINLGELIELQEENETLNVELYNMENKIAKLKDRCRKQENNNVSIAKLKTLSKENTHLKEDIQVYKSVICRLNNEMSFYQNKVGLLDRNCLEAVAQCYTSTSSPSDERSKINHRIASANDMLDKPQKTLLPLLLAYDEVIKEKNEIIKDHEKALEGFKMQCKEIVRENEDLHEVVAEKKENGTVSIEEWQFLHSNSLIVLEENDILHEQIKLVKAKNESMIKSHEEKVSKLKLKISALEGNKTQLESALAKSEHQCRMLMKHQSKLSEILEKRIPVEQHDASVLECKTLFEELKTNYNAERTILMDKLHSAEKERDRLVNELAELEAKNGRLQENIKTCEETLAVNAAQFKVVYNKMIEANKARDSSTYAMEEMMELSQRASLERENLERCLYEQRSLSERLILVRERECELVAELQNKIKEMENVHVKEIQKLIGRIKELERIVDGMGSGDQEKFIHLENLIEEKSKRIDHLETEKKQLQADLETVWKTTTNTIKDIRGRSIQNDHEGLET